MREKVTPNDAVPMEKLLPNGELYMGSFSGRAVVVERGVQVRRGVEERESKWEGKVFVAFGC